MNSTEITLRAGSNNPEQSFYEGTNASNRLSAEEIESSVPGMTAVSLTRLYEEQERLIEQRNALLDQNFISLTPKQQEQLDNMDKRLDSIESDIARLVQRQPQINVQAIEKRIADRERRLQNLTLKIRSQK